MNVIKINTLPQFQFIPRRILDNWYLNIELVSEIKGTKQTIECTATLLPNEKYNLEFSVFPIGRANETFSFTILNGLEVICLGKLMIVAQDAIVQNHSKKTNKYY